MYHPVGISKLSENQLSRLRNGHSVRVKLGSHHKVHLSVHQLKKLHSAHKHGKASTISFDPYQMEAHGSGMFGDIARKAKAFVQKHHLQDIVNPVIAKAKRVGHHAVNRASNYTHSQLDRLQPIEGHGMMSNELQNMAFNKMIGAKNPYYGGGVKHRTHKGKGLFGGVFNGAASLSNLIGGNGSGEAAKVLGGIGDVANAFGLGIAHKHHPIKRTRKPRARKGKGFQEAVDKLTAHAKDLAKDAAKQGISAGAQYLNDKVSGLGVIHKQRRIVGRRAPVQRKKYHGGGALYPSGYNGGSLFPA
jgi:hypothetical protein